MSNISINISADHHFNMIDEIQSAFGFYKFYMVNLMNYPSRETCFGYCNAFFKSKYGYSRYEDWVSFRGGDSRLIQSNPVTKNDLERTKKLESSISRNMLIRFFYLKGFESWEQFKPMILAFYPQVSVDALHQFFTNKSVDAPTMEKVYFVYQILS